MSDKILQEAVAAARAGNRQQAIDLTKQYIRSSPKEVRGWWALAKLSQDTTVKKESLKRVLRLDPHHAKAQQMMSEIEAQEVDQFPFEESPSSSSFSSSSWQSSSSSFSDSSSATFDESYTPDTDEPVFDFKNTSSPTAKSIPQASSRGGNNAELLIGIGLILLVLIAIPAIGYYAYKYQHRGLFGLLGPDLDRIATTNAFTVHYPSEWEGRIVEGNTALVAATNNIEAWERLAEQNLVNLQNIMYSDTSSYFTDEVVNGETVVLVVSPVTADLLQQLQNQTGIRYNSYTEYLTTTYGQAEAESEGFDSLKQDGIEVKYNVDLKERKIGGTEGNYGAMSLSIKVDEDALGDDPFAGMFAELFRNMNMGVYMASVTHNQQEYAFMLIAFGEDAPKHDRTAQRILNSLEFTQ